MKLQMVLLTTLLCLTAATAQALDFEASANLGVFDKYLWRGIDLSDSTAVTQGSVEISTSGFTLGVWGNAQLEDDGAYNGGEINEVDLTLDYTVDVGELLSVSAGNITYVLKDLEDTNEAYLGATVNTLLAPTLTAYWDWDQAEGNGMFYTAGVSHTFEPCDYAAINLGALVSYNDENDYSVGDYNDWHNYELSVSSDIKLTEQLTITPSVLYSVPISSESKEVIDIEWLAGVNLTYSVDF